MHCLSKSTSVSARYSLCPPLENAFDANTRVEEGVCVREYPEKDEEGWKELQYLEINKAAEAAILILPKTFLIISQLPLTEENK